MKKKILLLLLIVAQINAFAFDKTARTEYDDYSNDDYEYEMVGYANNLAAPIDSWTPFLLLAGVLYSVYYFEKKRKSSAVTKYFIYT